MVWAGHVARREKINAYVLLETLKESYSKKTYAYMEGLYQKGS